ncbi:SDR family oxidoreductase [Gryllotalpicola kribbensis]|jgi:nucleoside-diphosphate-sugar epimerase|uniref:SDR family oxidoreductase n=1 Tax=Gryllotalpicola kribbensis TaxID=993084 RepID=A0ABP8AE98_9MICO
MRVFVTGSTGWIGSATVDELLQNGHEVLGLARSDAGASKLKAKGAAVLRGDLDTPAVFGAGARDADAVVHLANKHDWADPEGNDRVQLSAVEAILEALDGSAKPFVISNGLSGIVDGRPVLETDASPAVGPDSDRAGTENLALEAVSRGIRSIAVRFAPTVHGRGDWGFVNWLAAAARKQGVSGYIGNGSAEWSAVHVTDAARLIRLGLESGAAGTRMHAVAEQSISTKAIAEALGEALGLPVTSIDPADAGEHFGVVGHFFGQTMTGSSELTRERLGWQPTGPGLVEDILAGAYSAD